LRLHDTVIIEIRQTGETFQKDIVKLDVDLIDPTATRPDIGSYIPNIVYINRDTDKKSGGGGGGGGNRGLTALEDDVAKFETNFVKTDTLIGMVVGTRNGQNYIKAGEITLAINSSSGETEARINADHIFIDGNTNIASFFSGSGSSMTFTASRLATDYISIAGTGGPSSYANRTFTWREKTIVTNVGVTMPTLSWSTSRYFLYSSTSGGTTASGTTTGRLVTNYTDGSVSPTTETIYYLGGTAPNV
jgi:hypothetical protein